MTHLSVNLNKVALLRNSRGADNPDPLQAATQVLDAGAQGITLHWREDERHTRRQDVIEIAALCRARGVEFNLEGDLRPALIDCALEVGAHQCTLVPVRPGELTSDHGWPLPAAASALTPAIERLRGGDIRVSLFIDPREESIAYVGGLGAQRVELYTEPYARAFGTPAQAAALDALRACAARARAQGLEVNAGHDLDLHNLPTLVTSLLVDEVSIGHALVADALVWGWEKTLSAYLAACRGEPCTPPRTRRQHQP